MSAITTRQQVVIATNNKGKLREFRDIFSHLFFEVLSLDDVNIHCSCEENGETLYDNALAKATFYKSLTSYPVIADDTGLFVDALNGQPGVYSARYAGKFATHKQNRDKLLAEMHNVTNRQAHFECCVIYIDQQGVITPAYGRTDGLIMSYEEGTEGFGYDSVFFSLDLNKPFAMATLQEKATVSHRSRAIQELMKKIP